MPIEKVTVCGVPYSFDKSGIIVNSSDVIIFGPYASIFQSLDNDRMLLTSGYFTTQSGCSFQMQEGLPVEVPAPNI